jgi:hypothetical protein
MEAVTTEEDPAWLLFDDDEDSLVDPVAVVEVDIAGIA